MRDIGILIKQTRQRKKMTQMLLAMKAGVSLPTIQNIEAHKTNPTLKLIEKIATPLGLGIHIDSIDPSWDYLIQFGLPLHSYHDQPEKKESFSFHIFSQEIHKAIHFISINKNESRLAEAVFALLHALKNHYPTFFDYFFDHENIHEFLKGKCVSGRIIKLSRIALAKLVSVL